MQGELFSLYCEKKLIYNEYFCNTKLLLNTKKKKKEEIRNEKGNRKKYSEAYLGQLNWGRFH